MASMALWEIDERLARMLEIGEDSWVDMDSGEVLTLEDIDALEMARAEKIEGWGLWIKNREAVINGIKAEEGNLKSRREALERKVAASKERYQQYLAGEKVDTAKLHVGYRKSESVDVTCPVDELPEEFQRIKVSAEPDKTALKAALKSGEKIDGVQLVTKQSMIIK